MGVTELIILYLALAAGLVFLSDKLGKYIDLLDKKTKISGAFLGGVLLAAVTSLPELFTSISATLLVGEKELVVGNILGSNLFNLFVLGACLIIFFNLFRKSKVEYKTHFFTFLGLSIIYPLICYGLLVDDKYQPQIGPINIICMIILVIYGLTIFFQPKESEENDDEEKEEDTSPLTVKQIVTRFIICSVALVSISIAITYVTDGLGEKLNLSATVAGALFLAVATSLPELVSCISLCRRGNFNAGLGDIIGSCLFNFCIIGLAEIMSYDGSLLVRNNVDAINMTWLTIICLVILFATLLIKKIIIDKKSQDEKLTWFNILTIGCGLVLVSGYIVFLII